MLAGRAPTAGETFAKSAERWLDARTARGVSSVRVDRSALGIHVTPSLGAERMLDITAEHMKTAQNVWATAHKLFRNAASSEQLRAHLKTAGVTRDALFTADKVRRPLRLYDMRATGITWCAVRGDAPLEIRERAGHASIVMTEVYIRTVTAVRLGFGEVFPTLPTCITGPIGGPECMVVPSNNVASRDKHSGRDRDRTCDPRCVKPPLCR